MDKTVYKSCGIKGLIIGILIGSIVTAIMIAILSANTKSSFLFKVSPEKRIRCTGEFTGPPHGRFEYISDADRMNMDKCIQTTDTTDTITDKWII